MGSSNLVFLENIEWMDAAGDEMVHRIPSQGSGEIKYGAQLTVRESQAAVFFYQGRAIEAYGAGRHTLKTANIPFLTKIVSIPWGMSSPLRAEVYMVNLKVFTDLKWGTRDPVAFKDSQLGLVRLRAFGVFNLQVVQPLLFINTVVGTRNLQTVAAIEAYLNNVIVSRFNDYMGETLDSIVSLPSRYDDLAHGLTSRLQADFSHFGLGLTHLYINAITPPPEVQSAIDDRSRMGVVGDLERLTRMKAAMAMEAAARNESTAGSGMGVGVGMMMPALFARHLAQDDRPGGAAAAPPAARCNECGAAADANARFCPQCGHQLVIFTRCEHCGKNLTPNALFCSRCGRSTQETPPTSTCRHCGAENLADSRFCNQCGEKQAT